MVAKHFPGARLASFERLTGGVSADVTRLDMILPDGTHHSVVLREHAARHDGHELATEFQALKTIHAAGLAVPKPLACDDTRSILEHPWLLMEFVDGSTQIPEDEAGARIDAMAAYLFGLHATPLTDLPGLPLVLDPIPELLEWLPEDARWNGLRARLRDLEGTQYVGERVLIHGDFWPENIIWDEVGSIRAVIDWEDACIGDPNADVAFSCLELRYVHGKDGEQRFKRAYGERRAIEPFRFALWQAYAGSHAYNHMGRWGLEPGRERHMRGIALETIAEAAEVIGR
ncbi:phosphotransferase family protein [Erythrobacter sp.]|uniref:phosphotransferase family protein n=1 Tax=Erythrobacter sp. TaxID=1042 RepID=UPI002EABDC88|nr:phosphotransferase [Erythrobacter sp.]